MFEDFSPNFKCSHLTIIHHSLVNCIETLYPLLLRNQICDTIKDWVQRTLSFSPLTAWETDQDMEKWLQLVLSCYPLRAVGGSKALNLERDIDPVERSLLLDLFQKQRHAGKSTTTNQLPMV